MSTKQQNGLSRRRFLRMNLELLAGVVVASWAGRVFQVARGRGLKPRLKLKRVGYYSRWAG